MQACSRRLPLATPLCACALAILEAPATPSPSPRLSVRRRAWCRAWKCWRASGARCCQVDLVGLTADACVCMGAAGAHVNMSLALYEDTEAVVVAMRGAACPARANATYHTHVLVVCSDAGGEPSEVSAAVIATRLASGPLPPALTHTARACVGYCRCPCSSTEARAAGPAVAAATPAWGMRCRCCAHQATAWTPVRGAWWCTALKGVPFHPSRCSQCTVSMVRRVPVVAHTDIGVRRMLHR